MRSAPAQLTCRLHRPPRGRGNSLPATLFPLVMLLSACTSPSILPLLRATRQAVESEITYLDAERQRDDAVLTERQRALAAAFDADMTRQQTLDPQWVREAVNAYATAREALLRHDMSLQHERTQRASNLRAALEAQDLAVSLLELQEGLWQRLPWSDLGLSSSSTLYQEYPNR